MSLRDRFRPDAPVGPQNVSETQAATALSRARGRGAYAGAPRAGKAVAAVLKPLLPEGTMGINELKRRWADIVGQSFARAAPEKLVGGVLTLRAPGAIAPFLQQQTPLLIERLKLAGAKIKSVKIEQRSAAPRLSNVRKLKTPLSAVEEAALEASLGEVEDAGLKSALRRLGRAVKQG